ncbi:MAG: S8/S53 family peptidase [Clostridium sp.]|nr:S8/S53 family peptidase [Clostridium sp.]
MVEFKKSKRVGFVLLVFTLFGIVLLGTEHYNNVVTKNSSDKEIVVAVIDSGIDVNTIPNDRVTDDTYDCFNDTEEVKDAYGHGTTIADLIVKNTNEKVKIMSVRVTDDEGNSTIDLVCEGIEYAAEHSADVINLSMNAYFYSEDTKLKDLIDKLALDGIPVVVSAGNSGDDVKYLVPANMESAIVVGAINNKGERYYFSNHGDTVDYYAYGKYSGELGTSYASAYVTAKLAEQMQIYDCGYKDALKRIPAKLWSKNLSVKGMDTGAEKEKDGTMYLGGSKKMENDLGIDILGLDWKNMDGDELWAYLRDTDYSYVGLFVSKLSEEEKKELAGKSELVSQNVQVSHLEYTAEEDAYVESSCEDVPYIDYVLQRYEKEKDVMRASEWVADNDAMFYISSPDRKKIGRYEITGIADHIAVQSTTESGAGYSVIGTNPSFDIGEATKLTYQNKSLSYDGTFTMPDIKSIKRFIRNARGSVVQYYDSNNKLIKEIFNNSYLPGGSENGDITYGISIKFTGFKSERTGYHSTPDKVDALNANSGGGKSNETAMWKQYSIVDDGEQIDKANFNSLETVRMEVFYNTVLTQNSSPYQV